MAGEAVVTKLTRPEFTNSEIALSTKAVCCSTELLFLPCARNEILLWSNGTIIKRPVGGRDCTVEGSASESAKSAVEPYIYRVHDNRIKETLWVLC